MKIQPTCKLFFHCVVLMILFFFILGTTTLVGLEEAYDVRMANPDPEVS